MEIKKLIAQATQPTLYEKGTSVMWTDQYISNQLLQIHLNEKVDLASRRITTIEKTVQWILSKTNGEKLNILDLGCGPGLYAKRFAEKGHHVTGVDFSEASIKYAQQEAHKKDLNINYIHSDYLNLQLDNDPFDLVILIYTDFGVLFPKERNRLLRIINNSLKPGGVFVFDVLNDTDISQKTTPKNWEISEKGFWRDWPHLVLSDSYLYSENKVILYQHMVMDDYHSDIYRFWTHFFSDSDLKAILENQRFTNIEFHRDIIPEVDLWSGQHVTFCLAEKEIKENNRKMPD